MKVKMFSIFFVILGLLSTMKQIVYWFRAFFHVKHVLEYLLQNISFFVVMCYWSPIEYETKFYSFNVQGGFVSKE